MCKNYLKFCPAYKDFNVFGVPDKGCCYSFMKYCDDVPTSVFKTIVYCIQKEDFYTLKELFEV